MVARAGSYCVNPFKGNPGVTWGYPFYLNIFNMMVDGVISHWVALLAGEETGTDGFRRAMQWLMALFYNDDGILDSPRLDRLKEALDVLMGMFDRVGSHTNFKKMMGMVCQTCYMADGHS